MSDPPADIPVSPELAEVRNVVRRLEAQLSASHGVDNPAYWRAMSDQLQKVLDSNRFAPAQGAEQDRSVERAHRWLVRVAAAYRSLAASGPVLSTPAAASAASTGGAAADSVGEPVRSDVNRH